MMHVRRRRHFMCQGAHALPSRMLPDGSHPTSLRVNSRPGWARARPAPVAANPAPVPKPPPLAGALYAWGVPPPAAAAGDYSPPPPGGCAVNPPSGGTRSFFPLGPIRDAGRAVVNPSRQPDGETQVSTLINLIIAVNFPGCDSDTREQLTQRWAEIGTYDMYLELTSQY